MGQNMTISTLMNFADLQNVNITLRILFRPQPQVLPKMYMNLGEDYDERVLPSITTEVLKAVVVRHDMLYSKQKQQSTFKVHISWLHADPFN